MKHWKMATALLGLWCAPAFVAGQAAPPPENYGGQYAAPGEQNPNAYQGEQNSEVQPGPGTLNYVEGAVYIDGKPMGNQAVGNVQMSAGQILETHEGKAEVLLNPGIYLRVGDHSAVKMITPSLTPSRVEILRGNAGVEVDQLMKENVVQVVNNGVTTQLVKTGYYEFDANVGRVRVFSGQAEVLYPDDNKWVKVKGGHEMPFVAGKQQKPMKFEADAQEDQLMAWSKLRSQQLAEANNQLAAEYYGAGFYPGWYWAPGWGYTYLGFSPFYSPFGWGYYPYGWGWGGGWGGWYGRGFYHGPGGFHGGMGGFHGRR